MKKENKSWAKYLVTGCHLFHGLFYASTIGVATSISKEFGGSITIL